MPASLLATKLFIPPPGKNVVLRPRLLEKIDETLLPGIRLALICAPAGFGKTTLICSWTAGLRSREGRPLASTAWLSLDEQDNDPSVFWIYFISALQTQSASLGMQSLNLLQTASASNLVEIVSQLVNDLLKRSEPFVVVLDNYHLIRKAEIHQSLSFLIDHLPPQIHVMILSRTDPPLPLALLRGRGQVLEIRMAELRFTDEEAFAYMNEKMKLTLTPSIVGTLNEKTEGWAAGLQMAGLSLQGRQDAAQFVQTFSGSNRFILDYLLEEVLNRQTGEVEEFLLNTSILKTLCGSLCDAVMGTLNTSQSMLEHLERANLFLIPLDEEHHWYRYHALFGELLRTQLERIHGEVVADLHRKAATWYEEKHFPIDAGQHWIAAHEFQHAAQLVEGEATQFLKNGLANQALGWLNSLPDHLYKTHPKLNLVYSWGLISTGQFNLVESRLQAIELDHPEVYELPDTQAEIDATRAMIAFSSGNFDQAIRLGLKTVANLSKTHHLYSGVLFGIGNAYRFKGKLKLAVQYLTEAARNAEEINSYAPAVSSLCILGDTYLDQGLLSLAKETYLHSLFLNERTPGSTPVICLAHLGLSKLYYEWNDLGKALNSVCEALKLVENWGNITILSVAYAHKAFCELAAGNPDEAAISMESAEEIAPQLKSNPFAVKTMRAVTIQYLLRSGQVEQAYQMIPGKLEATSSSVEPSLDERLAEISTLVAFGHTHQNHSMLTSALAQADELLTVLQAGGRNYLRFHVKIQKVNALLDLEQEQTAINVLSETLAEAEPESYTRLFLDQGAQIAALLEKIRPTSLPAGYIDRLLAAYQGTVQAMSMLQIPTKAKATSTDPRVKNTITSLVEPLTWRELEVIRLIAEGCSNKEIALKLCVSLRTVKFHATSIYSKLGVTSRTQAVHRARELGFI